MSDAKETPKEGSLAKELFAGATGGIAQVLIGQPFDIIKVRLQTTSQYKGALDAGTQIFRKEGPAAFYKGTLTPLVGIGACVSIQFAAFHYARRTFESRNDSTGPLSPGQYYAAGAFAGLANSVLSGPIEHVRIRLQTQPHVTNPADRLYRGPLHCIQTLVGRAGVANGLYRGQAVTLLREAQAYGVWFLTYEYLMQADVKRRGLKDRSEVEAWRLAAYGGLAGETLWLASYPFDVIKSKMQTDGLGVAGAAKEVVNSGGAAGAVKNAAKEQFEAQRYKNMRDCVAQTYREQGMAGFWKGLGPTLFRALPVSAATFAVAEMTLRAIS